MEIIEIDVDKVKSNPNQPRKEFDEEKLKELANNIKERGLINPIQVKKIDNGYYELIGGERRLMAHKIAGLKKIIAICKDYKSESQEAISMILDNMHREDLSPVEKAKFLKRFMIKNNLKSIYELSKVLSTPSRTVSGWFELAKEEETYNYGRKKNIASSTILRVIEGTKNKNLQKEVINKIYNENITGKKANSLARIAQNSPKDVKEALFNNKISSKQADKISKIKDEKIRTKIIEAHKNIKNIDKNLERNIDIKSKNKNNTIKVKEIIQNFRSNAIENQKITQRTMKSLLSCVSIINLMDDKQLKSFENYQALLELCLSNALEFSENLKERIKTY